MRRKGLRNRVLKEIQKRPQTSLEIAEELGVPYDCVQPRTSELRVSGHIQDSGRKGRSHASSSGAIVWEAVLRRAEGGVA